MRIEPRNVIFFTGFILLVIIRETFKWRTRSNKVAVCRCNVVEKVLLSIFTAAGPLCPLLYLFTPWLSFADYQLPTFTLWCGSLFMGAAVWLFLRSHADLGLNWSVTLQLREGHQIIRRGVYQSVRHPMYAAFLLCALAQGMLLDNWLAGWTGMVTFFL